MSTGGSSGDVSTTSNAHVVGDVVELNIPVQADLVVLARLTAATVASRAGFDVEEVEDFRLAVDELCVSIVNDGDDGRLHLTFTREAGMVEVVCTFEPESGSDHSLGPRPGVGVDRTLSTQIIDALVDEHGEDLAGGQRRAWLRKRTNRHET
jgi:hypothetical protein